MKDGAVKTPTLAVLCQTKEQTPGGVAEEGLGDSCSPRDSRLRMGAGMLEHLAGPHTEPVSLR